MQGFPAQILIRREATVHKFPHCLRSSGFGGDTINLTTWRRKRNEGAFEALSPKKRGPKTVEPDPLASEIEHLSKCLRQADLIIDVQEKYPGCWA